MTKRRAWAFALAALAVAAPVRAARSDVLRGRVVAPDRAPLAGAMVVATGPAVVGSRAELTDADGAFTMTLPTGTYALTVSYDGAQVRRPGVEVAPASGAVVAVVFDPPPGEVVVVDAAPSCCGGESCAARPVTGITLTDAYVPPRAAPAPARGCAHCASGGADAPVGGALLVLAALRRRRATGARPSRPGRRPPR
ncbi:MAG: carboxypeptidase regulatory-like domain-containing protein [Myxococcales bacterium]|nr:carboxypeptidase regulatory-like domain-containing protein [Myxococcales bacterium]